MFDLQWITGPLVGSVIGYITNDIAVRMLFRPHTEKRLFGKRVPFTPGLIPKERPRLARAIRDVLDQELLSPEVLEAALLSDRVMGQLDQLASNAVSAILSEERTPRVLLEGAFGEEDFTSFEEKAKRTATLFLMEKIMESGVERTVAEVAVEEARKRLAHSAAGIADLILSEKRTASLEDSLSQTIREMLATHVPGVIDGMIDNAIHEGLDTPVSELAGRHADRLEDVRAFLLEQYRQLIRKSLPGALKMLDLGAVVEERLNGLDMAELEALIMQVMKKELRAIVWLGALLGAIMGTVNTLILLL